MPRIRKPLHARDRAWILAQHNAADLHRSRSSAHTPGCVGVPPMRSTVARNAVFGRLADGRRAPSIASSRSSNLPLARRRYALRFRQAFCAAGAQVGVQSQANAILRFVEPARTNGHVDLAGAETSPSSRGCSAWCNLAVRVVRSWLKRAVFCRIGPAPGLHLAVKDFTARSAGSPYSAWRASRRVARTTGYPGRNH